jgi:hypothetical protein
MDWYDPGIAARASDPEFTMADADLALVAVRTRRFGHDTGRMESVHGASGGRTTTPVPAGLCRLDATGTTHTRVVRSSRYALAPLHY